MDVKANSLKLKELQDRRRTPEQFSFVREMLDSKFEGLQAGAIKVLGAWGGSDEKTLIREFLSRTFQRDFAWSVRGVAISALYPLIEPDDANWILEICFSRTEMTERHEILRLFSRLTPDKTRSFLSEKLRSDNSIDRWAAARAIMAIKFPDQRQLLTPLLKDEDRWVRGTATNGVTGT